MIESLSAAENLKGFSNEYKEVVSVVFGLQSNQQAAVSRATEALKEAERKLREAQKELARTPRASNLQATRARDACQREVNDAKARLRTAESELRRSS